MFDAVDGRNAAPVDMVVNSRNPIIYKVLYISPINSINKRAATRYPREYPIVITPEKVDPCLRERYLVVTKGTDVILRGTPGGGDVLLISRCEERFYTKNCRTCSTDFYLSISNSVQLKIVFLTTCVFFRPRLG